MAVPFPPGLSVSRGRIVCRLFGGLPLRALGSVLLLAGGGILGAAIWADPEGGSSEFGHAGWIVLRLLGGMLGAGFLLLGGFVAFYHHTVTLETSRGQVLCHEGWLFLGVRRPFPLRSFTRLAILRVDPPPNTRGTPLETYTLRLEGPGMEPLPLVLQWPDRDALVRTAAEISRLSGVPTA